MLNKDQYNQDEYNNYYKQESESAEIKGFNEEGSLIGKALPVLGLTVLGLAGYFGLKLFNSTDDSITLPIEEKIVIKEETPLQTGKISIEEKIKKTIQENNIQANTTPSKKTIQEKVTTQVQETITSNQKMSNKDISEIVNIVMNKMEKENISTAKSTAKDDALLTALNSTENETAKKESEELKKVIDYTANAIEEPRKKDTSYNKVTLTNNSKQEDKELNELSEQIKKLLNMAGESDIASKKTTFINEEISSPITKTNDVSSKSYEASISTEIQVRSNEMRIIIVKPGDTLNKIAKRAYGDASAYQKILDGNPKILNHSDKIYVGQKLRIPN